MIGHTQNFDLLKASSGRTVIRLARWSSGSRGARCGLSKLATLSSATREEGMEIYICVFAERHIDISRSSSTSFGSRFRSVVSLLLVSTHPLYLP